MNFPIDRCAGTRLAAWLEATGHDVRAAPEFDPDPAAERIELMADLLARHGPELAGSIVTIRGGRIRISPSAGEP